MGICKGTGGLVASTLAATLLFGTVGCGDSSGGNNRGVITPVWEWVVGFATETGEWISERASTLSAAMERAWTGFWGPRKINGVIVDEQAPLKGTFDGNLKCRVDWGRSGSAERKNYVEMGLDHPRMVRESVDTDIWMLAPEERKRIDDLRDGTMRVD